MEASRSARRLSDRRRPGRSLSGRLIAFAHAPAYGTRALNAGTVWINNYGGLDVYSAYGGRGFSGFGYEQGPQTIDEYTTLKTVRQTL